MTTLDLVVVRHGRTSWNAEKRFQGRSDVELDDVGRAQARALGRALGAEPFELAVTSDLIRARTTAELVLAVRAEKIALDVEPLWREFDFGSWEGLTWPEIVARFPDADRPLSSGRFVAPAGGSETFDDLTRRIAAAVATLRAKPLAHVLVVTHAGPLHALLRLAYGSESEALALRFVPASINRFRIDEDGIAVVGVNETA